MSFGHDVKQGPGATRASSTEWPDGERVGLQQSNCRRRRRRYDADDEEDCSPIAESDAKRDKDGDVVQAPRGKRRKVNTAPKKQARLRPNSPSQQAQQGPKRRQSQRRVSNPQSSGASALGEETPAAAFASFEEWPLEAVLKRVWVGGAATFQVEFSPWNPCTNHGRHERAPENPRRKLPAGGISSSIARTCDVVAEEPARGRLAKFTLKFNPRLQPCQMSKQSAAEISASLIRNTTWSGSRRARMSCSMTRTSGSFAPRSMQRSQTGTMADLIVRYVDCSG